jgi:hypothetical protein
MSAGATGGGVEGRLMYEIHQKHTFPASEAIQQVTLFSSGNVSIP